MPTSSLIGARTRKLQTFNKFIGSTREGGQGSKWNTFLTSALHEHLNFDATNLLCFRRSYCSVILCIYPHTPPVGWRSQPQPHFCCLTLSKTHYLSIMRRPAPVFAKGRAEMKGVGPTPCSRQSTHSKCWEQCDVWKCRVCMMVFVQARADNAR